MSDPANPNVPRSDPRIRVRMPVRLSTIDPETDPWTGKTFFRTLEETVANVSRGGAFVETLEPIGPGRRLLIELELPGGQFVQTTGRVVWAKRALMPEAGTPGTGPEPAGSQDRATAEPRAAGVGVEFLGGPRQQLLALERFLARSARRRRRAEARDAPVSRQDPR